jgi:parallel beta-helix repeat protein
MKKLRYGLVLVCFAVVVSVLVGTASAKTWYVDDEASPGIDFTKIQLAVDAASDGDIIYVYAGTYNENVEVDKSLTLQGEDREDTIIDASGRGSSITVGVDGCTINGFNVMGSDDSWVYAGIRLESNNNTITNNLINFNQGRGILLLGPSDNNTIATNDINFNDCIGICLRDDCFDNRLIDNYVCFNDGHGIDLDGDCTNSRVMGNNVSFNGEIGIYVHRDNITLTNNTVSNNEGGIRLGGTRNCILRANIINNNICNFNVEYGHIQDIDTSNIINGKPIYYLVNQANVIINSSWNAGYVGVVDSNNITVKDLTITNNGQGILFDEVKNSRIENVIVVNNTYGIYLIDSRDITLRNNNASSNEKYGIYVDGEYDNSIDTSNLVNGKAVHYFYDIHDQTISNLNITHLTIAESDNILIKDNKVNNGDGIVLCGIEDSIISDNIISGNFYGIRVCSSDNNKFTNNSANMNKNNGIDIGWSNNNTLEDNHADENEQYGIKIHGHSNNNTITNNYVNANKKYGIRLSSADNNTVSSNLAVFNTAGIHLSNSNYNKIINNNASFNDRGINVWYSSNNNTIMNNIINIAGIFLYESNGNELINNTISNIFGSGSNNSLINNDIYAGFIYLSGNDNVLVDNRVYDNYINSMDTRMYGIQISGDNNSIVNNTVYNNTGFGVRNTLVYGIYLSGNKNTLTDNNVYENNAFGNNPSVYGVYLSGDNSTMTNNTIYNTNGTGLGVCEGSNDNNIYHNNFMDNNNHASDYGSNNSWDNGPIIGGNYWSDHACSGNPSDGSQPYTIGGGTGAVDRYPFEDMNGWLTITTPQKGDLNGDNKITPADAAIALQIAATGTQCGR